MGGKMQRCNHLFPQSQKTRLDCLVGGEQKSAVSTLIRRLESICGQDDHPTSATRHVRRLVLESGDKGDVACQCRHEAMFCGRCKQPRQGFFYWLKPSNVLRYTWFDIKSSCNRSVALRF